MKLAKFLLLSVITLSLFFTQTTFAQDQSKAQEFLTDYSKYDKAFDKLEKALVPTAQSHLNNFTVTELKIDRKTGMITVLGKNEKGQTQTLKNVSRSPHYTSTASSKSKKGVFDRLWDWLFGPPTPPPSATPPPPSGPPTPKKPSPEDIMTHM